MCWDAIRTNANHPRAFGVDLKVLRPEFTEGFQYALSMLAVYIIFMFDLKIETMIK